MSPGALFGDLRSTAVLSDCGLYRYELGRHYSTLGDACRVVWVMLNPSTADASKDDPTIRRCSGFTHSWGYDALTVVNLFALRATDPSELAGHPDPVGPDNDEAIRRAVEDHRTGLVVAAWGAHPMARERASQVAGVLGRAWCLGTTKSGAPRHPLYVRSSAPPVRWPGDAT